MLCKSSPQKNRQSETISSSTSVEPKGVAQSQSNKVPNEYGWWTIQRGERGQADEWVSMETKATNMRDPH